jgi:hypothetical protein
MRNLSLTTSQISGIIDDIDLVNRQLALRSCFGPKSVDVPPTCRILLRGEPVKLRLLQPGDYIKVTLSKSASSSAAQQIEVQGHPPGLSAQN